MARAVVPIRDLTAGLPLPPVTQNGTRLLPRSASANATGSGSAPDPCLQAELSVMRQYRRVCRVDSQSDGFAEARGLLI